MGLVSFAAFRPHPGKDAELVAVIADRLPLLRKLGLATNREHIVVRTPSGIVLEVSEWVNDEAIKAAHRTPEVLELWKRFEACSDYLPPNESSEFAGMFPTFPAVLAEPGIELLAWGPGSAADEREPASAKRQKKAGGKEAQRSNAELEALTKSMRRSLEAWGMKTRSKGTTLLLVGSATAVRNAAVQMGRDVGMAVYRIDISRIVSTYIGETEKNIERVFEVAKGVEAILLFDEADALFGKRTEMKNSHDRYANIEVSYLLQKLESHSGVVLLGVKKRSNIDEAYIRRLDAVVAM